jgi:hypothetical protein
MPATLPRTWSAWSLKRLRKAEGILNGLTLGRDTPALIAKDGRTEGGHPDHPPRVLIIVDG